MSASNRFDPSAAQQRLALLHGRAVSFGEERDPRSVYLNDIVADRSALTWGLQVIRDELQFARDGEGTPEGSILGREADWCQPGVCLTLAHTNCGDRVHQGEDASLYNAIVAARFATLSEMGGLKTEEFYPPGGGTDHGKTLAHVTCAHQTDSDIRERLYGGNRSSYSLVAMDLQTHCGRLDEPSGHVVLGKTQEARWRHPRAACGAVVGALGSLAQEMTRERPASGTGDPVNPVTQRILTDLGQEFRAWFGPRLQQVDGQVIQPPEAPLFASIVLAVRGVAETLRGLYHEDRETGKVTGEEPFVSDPGQPYSGRGVAHLTASLLVNRPNQEDSLLYLTRATLFEGEAWFDPAGFCCNPACYQLGQLKADKPISIKLQNVCQARRPTAGPNLSLRSYYD